MTLIRPNAEPAATSVAAGDIFLIDGTTGVRALAATQVGVLDANLNLPVNNVIEGLTSTATAAGTTILTAASAAQQFFTGSTTQTVQLPVVSTYAKAGAGFFFQNSSTGALTVTSSGGNTVKIIGPGAFAIVTCVAITGTTAASWQATYFADIVVSGKVLTLNNSLTLAGTDGTTLTFQGTDTYVGRATTDTLTNKTFDTAGTGNVFKINGTTISANTGTGVNVLATSPTLVTPALGTPASGVATNLTGTAAGLTAGNVTTNANLTGDVTSTGNATTLTNAPVIAKVLTGFVSGAGTVSATDSILAAFQKAVGNDALKAPLASPALTGVPTAPTPTVGTATTQIATAAMVTAAVSASGGGNVSNFGTPTAGQPAVWTSATTIKGVSLPTVSTALNTGAATGTGGFVSGTYTTPAGAWLEIIMVGGGAGASGSGTGGGTGGNGAATTFGTSLLTANGGTGAGNGANGGAGGTATGGNLDNIIGANGNAGNLGTTATDVAGPAGASSPRGGAGGGGLTSANAAVANSGSGGGAGGLVNIAAFSGTSGAAGGYLRAIITSPLSTYSYSVGTGGAGGAAGTSGQAGGAGGSGGIWVIEHYS